MGWKGVGVGDALGAAVTNTNGNADCAGATVPHPASIELARRIPMQVFLMSYGNGVIDGVCVMDAVGVIVAVYAVVGEAVGVGEEVEIKVEVAVDGIVNVGTVVFVRVCVAVEVGKFGMIVTPGMGVRVGMFGTQSLCPA